MEKIATKLAELTQRVLVLKAQIAQRCRYASFLDELGRPDTGKDQIHAAMQKRLSSLKRSCQILARHISTDSSKNACADGALPVGSLAPAELGAHLVQDLSSNQSTHGLQTD
jgi:hypothetical protein